MSTPLFNLGSRPAFVRSEADAQLDRLRAALTRHDEAWAAYMAEDLATKEAGRARWQAALIHVHECASALVWWADYRDYDRTAVVADEVTP